MGVIYGLSKTSGKVLKKKAEKIERELKASRENTRTKKIKGGNHSFHQRRLMSLKNSPAYKIQKLPKKERIKRLEHAQSIVRKALGYGTLCALGGTAFLVAATAVTLDAYTMKDFADRMGGNKGFISDLVAKYKPTGLKETTHTYGSKFRHVVRSGSETEDESTSSPQSSSPPQE